MKQGAENGAESSLPRWLAVVLVQTASQAHTGTHRSRKFDAPATVTVQYYNSEKRRWEYYDHRTYSNDNWHRWELSDTMPCRYTGQYRAVGCVTAGNNGYLDDVESMSNVIYVA